MRPPGGASPGRSAAGPIDLRREDAPPGPVVQGFSGKGFRIDGRIFGGGVKLTPDRAEPWDAPALLDLREEDFADLLAERPQFILLGTGASLFRPPPSLVSSLERCDIGLDAMDSRAAARAWGLLRAEGRHICAALMAL